MIKFGYFGSPDFSASFLKKILTDKELKQMVEISFVVTQPDRPVGRKQILTPTPVKQIAKKYHLKIFEIENLNSSLESEELKFKIKNLDLAVVYAFSQIIPKNFLNQPKLGFWNIHPSLLPRFRGPSPIVYPLILGEEKTGITIFQMDEKIDHGPIIAQESLTIKNDDYRTDLEKKLTDLAFAMFKKLISTDSPANRLKRERWQASFNQLKLTAQTDNLATYTRLLKKDDGFIEFNTLKKILNNQSLEYQELPFLLKEYLNKYSKEKKIFIKKFFQSGQLFYVSCFMFHLFRGLSPWPGLWTILPNGKRLKIIDVELKENKEKKFYVLCFMFHIKTVQLEGKKPVDFDTFNRAYKIF